MKKILQWVPKIVLSIFCAYRPVEVQTHNCIFKAYTHVHIKHIIYFILLKMLPVIEQFGCKILHFFLQFRGIMHDKLRNEISHNGRSEEWRHKIISG